MNKILFSNSFLVFAACCIFLLTAIIMQFFNLNAKLENPAVANDIFMLIVFLLALFSIFFVFMACLQQQSKKMLTKLAYSDELTNLPNKSYFKKQIASLLKTHKNNYAYVILDLDKFKIINDKWGFTHGDNLLKFIAEIFRQELDPQEISCRATADIFHLLIKFETREQLIKRLATLSLKIRAYKFSENVLYNLNVYAGIYIFDNLDISLNIAGDNALLAREKAKLQKNKFYFIYNDSLRTQIVYNQELENNMQESLLKNEFIVYLQPKYDLDNYAIVAAEALVRWNHPEQGLIPPDKFIPLFEKNGFIIQLDNYVLDKVCTWLAERIANQQEIVPISVNQSRLHLYDADYLETLITTVQKHHIPPELIELELTETVFFENAKKMKTLFHRLHEYGFKISLDDFGTGYSSLNMLGVVLVDILKLDRAFFNDNFNTKNGRQIIESIIILAQKINMSVVAEGVETLEQVEFLKSVNCDLIQGYYFSKPLSINDFEKVYDLQIKKIKECSENV